MFLVTADARKIWIRKAPNGYRVNAELIGQSFCREFVSECEAKKFAQAELAQANASHRSRLRNNITGAIEARARFTSRASRWSV